jgi:hypothetical protein
MESTHKHSVHILLMLVRKFFVHKLLLMYEVWVYLTLMIPGYYSSVSSVCCILFVCGYYTDSSIDGLSLSLNCLYAFL